MSDAAAWLYLLSGFSLVLAAAGVVGWLVDWIDARRTVAPLTRDQLAARGVTWHPSFVEDAEGEVAP